MKQNLKISKLLLKNRILNREKVRLLTKKNPRYNSLFLDFFYKWNKDKSEQINGIFDENYKVNDTKDNHILRIDIVDNSHLEKYLYEEG